MSAPDLPPDSPGRGEGFAGVPSEAAGQKAASADPGEPLTSEAPSDGEVPGGSVEEGAPTPADPLAEMAAQRDEYLDSLRRLQADFENYRKRVIKQQADQVARAAEDLVGKLLPVLDTVDLALAHAVADPEAPAGEAPAPAQEGGALAQVAGALSETLAKEGLDRIDPVGQPFDPTEHDAVMHEPGGEDGGTPEVTEVLRAGYRWRGRVLRPAMVKVKG